MANISREHLSRIEAGKVTLTEDMKHTLLEAVEKFNPDNPMFLLFDYVRIRFPTMDIKHSRIKEKGLHFCFDLQA